jgi:hypothetical protein
MCVGRQDYIQILQSHSGPGIPLHGSWRQAVGFWYLFAESQVNY